MWTTIADITGLYPVTIKSFLTFEMLLDIGAALQAAEVAEPWAHGSFRIMKRGHHRPGNLAEGPKFSTSVSASVTADCGADVLKPMYGGMRV